MTSKSVTKLYTDMIATMEYSKCSLVQWRSQGWAGQACSHPNFEK